MVDADDDVSIHAQESPKHEEAPCCISGYEVAAVTGAHMTGSIAEASVMEEKITLVDLYQSGFLVRPHQSHLGLGGTGCGLGMGYSKGSRYVRTYLLCARRGAMSIAI
jgi:hypothetical protein